MSYHNEPICITGIKKSLKISKGVVHQRRTDNTMAKRKRTKGQTAIYKTLHRKLKIEAHENQRGTQLSSK
jgi:hypothetical protein